MKKTDESTALEKLVNLFWGFMCHKSQNTLTNEAFITVLAIMYAYHKGFSIRIKANGGFDTDDNNDTLYCDLINASPIDESMQNRLCQLVDSLSCVGRSVFNQVYFDVLKQLFDKVGASSGWKGDFYTPIEITKLIAYFIRENECNSVFDPFCGTAVIAQELSASGSSVHFVGQELNLKTSLYARVILEATHTNGSQLCMCDSLESWSNERFDAVVSCPPLGLKLNTQQKDYFGLLNTNYQCQSVEDVVLTLPFDYNQAKVSVLLTGAGICFSGGRNYNLRKHIVENNLLDAVVSLPTNMMYATGIPCVLLVCRRNRNVGDPVRFYHAENYHIGKGRQRTFDINRFLHMIHTSGEDCMEIATEEIREYDYSLAPSLYTNKSVALKAGQRVRVEELIEHVCGDRNNLSEVDVVFSAKTFGGSLEQVLLNANKPLNEGFEQKNLRHYCADGSKFLLAFGLHWGERRYGLVTDGRDFYCPSYIKVFKVNESLVTPEYLVYLLLHNPVISKTGNITDNLKYPVVIDTIERQKMLVNKYIQEYSEKKRSEQEAEAKRLGVKQNISDLQHMLGTTQVRINNIIGKLERKAPSSDDYHQLVIRLIDNVKYMNRAIEFSNAKIDPDSLNLKKENLVEFMQSYANSWSNYGGQCFELSIINQLKTSPEMSFDKYMLTVMLDSILNNAIRHGFHKNKNYTIHNEVQIQMSTVKYENAPYVLLSIANNGDMLTDEFTIEDYVTKGRFAASTGNSGLGGYHVYQIVKGHNGFLRLDKNKQWGMIIDILLPIDFSTSNDILSYEHECI